jgi:hypothetical protein
MKILLPPGRLTVKVEINFNNPLESISEIKKLCKVDKMRANIITFATAVRGLADVSLDPDFLVTNVFDKKPTEQFIDSVCQVSDKMVNYEKSLLIYNLWVHIEETDKCKLLYLMYNNTNYVNPNTKERIAKVLDEIFEAEKNQYSVKIIVSANNVTKVLQTDTDF